MKISELRTAARIFLTLGVCIGIIGSPYGYIGAIIAWFFIEELKEIENS